MNRVPKHAVGRIAVKIPINTFLRRITVKTPIIKNRTASITRESAGNTEISEEIRDSAKIPSRMPIPPRIEASLLDTREENNAQIASRQAVRRIYPKIIVYVDP